MTREEILKKAGFPNTPVGVAAFYKKYNTPDAFFKKHGGSLSGAPHDGQPTADEFFNYGSHANDAVNVPMSNPFFAANGGTPYYGGPVRPYAYGGGMDYFDEGGPNELPRLSKRKRKAVDKAVQTSYNEMLEGAPNDQFDEFFYDAGLSNDKARKFMVDATGPSGATNDPGTYARNINNLLGRDVIPFPVNQNRMTEENERVLLSKPMYYNDDEPAGSYGKLDYENLTPIQRSFNQFDPAYEGMAYGGYMDMGGNTASPMNYGAFNVPMMYGGDEDQFGGSLNENNNQQYPILDSGGLGEFADGGDTSALVKIIIAAGKARKKALGGDTVTQGGNSDNYAENLRNSFQGAIKNNIERNKIEKSLESLTGMQKAFGGSSNQFNDGGYANNEYTPDKNFNSNVYDPRKLEIAGMYGQNAQNAENDFTNSFNDFSNQIFKENGGLIKADVGFEQWAQRTGKVGPNNPLFKKQVAPFYGQKNYFGNTSSKPYKAPAEESAEALNIRKDREARDAALLNSTSGNTDTEDTQDFDPKKAKTYRFRVNNAAGENYYNNNPNSYYKVNQRNAKRLNSLPEGYGLKSVENQYGAGARLASNVVGLFGGKEKGAKTLNRFAPKKIKYNFGKIDGSDTTQSDTTKQNATQPGTSQQMQKDPKDPGFIQNLITKNKQRKADKLLNRQNTAAVDAQIQSARQSVPQTPYTLSGYSDDEISESDDWFAKQVAESNANEAESPNFMSKPGSKIVQDPFNSQAGFAYGGGLRKLRRYQGNVDGNEVDQDNPVGMEDISVTAKRKSDIDTSRIGMAAPTVFNVAASAKNKIAAQSAAQNTTNVDDIVSANNSGKDLGNFTVNQDAFKPNESQYGRFYGSAPADYGTPVIRYGGNAYQEGGGPEQGQQEQIMQGVASMLQQGAQPEEVAQQLVQMGIPQEQVMQIIQAVMQQLQGGQGQPMQPAMRYGGYAMGGSSDEDDEYYEDDIDEDEIDRLQKLGYTVQRY